MRRFPIDLYHINDYHGAVAPLHLLPRTIPCCLSLHNAEFQGTFDCDRFQSRRHMRDALKFHLLCFLTNLVRAGKILRTDSDNFTGLWAMRTPAERDEVCRAYNLDPDIVRKYVQFGEVFNLLHAGASYLRTWQKGYGAVGVSEKYGKRSFARKFCSACGRQPYATCHIGSLARLRELFASNTAEQRG
jgi:alpha-1,3-glucan synthase